MGGMLDAFIWGVTQMEKSLCAFALGVVTQAS